MQTSHCTLCVLSECPRSHSLSPHLLLLWLNCPESFVDSDIAWWVFIRIQKQSCSPCSLQLCPGEEICAGLWSVAADPKRWQSARRKSDYAQIFHASRSFPSLCGAACFLVPIPCSLAFLRPWMLSPSRSVPEPRCAGQGELPALRGSCPEPSLPSVPFPLRPAQGLSRFLCTRNYPEGMPSSRSACSLAF